MAERWEKWLARWEGAGFVDAPAAARIRDYEAGHAEKHKFHWPVIFAVAFGGLMLAAGILLFVAAHWDRLSPSARFATVLLLVAAFHVGGAFAAGRFEKLSVTLHAVGTACLGAGIFLAAQIFNLEEDWSGGFLLWALGAGLGWFVLRQIPQAVLAALLVPIWLSGKWSVETNDRAGADLILVEGLWLLAVTYLAARTQEQEGLVRRSLVWIGGLAILPLSIFVPNVAGESWGDPLPAQLKVIGWTLALGLPLLLAVVLRGKQSWPNAIAAVWIVILGTMNTHGKNASLWAYAWNNLGAYVWCAAGAIGLIAWGLHEKRKERINLGVAGFAITVAWFYFSSVMDKLGRSAALMGFGVLFLVGGWFLEKERRRLITRLGGSAP